MFNHKLAILILLGVVSCSFVYAQTKKHTTENPADKSYSESVQYFIPQFKRKPRKDGKKPSAQKESKRRAREAKRTEKEALKREKDISNAKSKPWLKAAGNDPINENLVRIPVTLYDRLRRQIVGVRPSEIHIFENGVEQSIKHYGTLSVSQTIIILLDVSPSFAYRAKEIKQALTSFINNLDSKDRVMIVTFHRSIKVILKPTLDRVMAAKKIRKISYSGGTSLYNAVEKVSNDFAFRVEGKKTVILFSDGVDTTSRKSDYVKSMTNARRSNTVISGVYYDSRKDIFTVDASSARDKSVPNVVKRGVRLGSGTSISEYTLGKHYMSNLVYVTGGRSFVVGDSKEELQQAFDAMQHSLKTQAYIEYVSNKPKPKTGGRKIRVRVNRPNLIVHVRDTYY